MSALPHSISCNQIKKKIHHHPHTREGGNTDCATGCKECQIICNHVSKPSHPGGQTSYRMSPKENCRIVKVESNRRTGFRLFNVENYVIFINGDWGGRRTML